ncbi:MAG: hypothetical protein ACREFY_00895, partial [Acetobacteraceae bacterium]
MRHLVQPGPALAERIESLVGSGLELDYILQPGRNLTEALTAPLVAAGLRSAAIVFGAAALAPFRFVLPGPARDAAHVAWFSDPHDPGGDPSRPTLVETANATFGWRGGVPFVHCHGVWVEPDGTRRGGHMLPEETFITAPGAVSSAGPPAAPARARAWGLTDVAITVDADPETNFPLFHPIAVPVGAPARVGASAGLGASSGSDAPAAGTRRVGRLITARIRPNQE